MLAFVHDELRQEHDQTREALKALSKQLELANRTASRFRTSLPNRDAAIAELSCETDGAPGVKRYVGVFVADALSALRLRHGNEISEYILHEVNRKNVSPLVPDGKIFRWSALSVLAVWHSQKQLAEISAEIAHSCQMPFDCRAFVGTRTATFRIAIRFAVWDAQSDIDELLRTLDDFSKGGDKK